MKANEPLSLLPNGYTNRQTGLRQSGQSLHPMVVVAGFHPRYHHLQTYVTVAMSCRHYPQPAAKLAPRPLRPRQLSLTGQLLTGCWLPLNQPGRRADLTVILKDV